MKKKVNFSVFLANKLLNLEIMLTANSTEHCNLQSVRLYVTVCLLQI